MREENTKLDTEISNLKSKIKQEGRGFNDKIKKNPKAGLAVGSLILAALVIGMIASFGGVGLINGEILGKVILTGLTAGTATYMADKMTGGKLSNKIDDWFGDSDKKTLNKLERSQAEMNKLDLEKKLYMAGEKVKEKKIENHLLNGEIKKEEIIGKNNDDKVSGYKVKEVKDVIAKLEKNRETTNLKSALAVSLDLASTDFEKEGDVKKLLNKAGEFANGEDKTKLKEIFKVALGVDDDGKKDLKNLKDISIDNRAKILKELTKAVTDAKKTAADATGADAPVKIKSTEIEKINNDLSAAISQNKQVTTGRF